MKGTTLIGLTSEELKTLTELLEQSFLDGFSDEEEFELYEKLKKAEASNAGN